MPRWWKNENLTEAEFEEAREQLLAKAPVPVLWLFGKTGSGKSSIVQYLTGVEAIEIGNGYQPQTKHSSLYSFPEESDPLLKFLDTRGISEAGYDPTEDITVLSNMAHLLVLIVRTMDHALDELVDSLKRIRSTNPELPVLLVLTALHDGYPGEQHPAVDPYTNSDFPLPTSIPDEVRQSLEVQYERFDGLVSRAVPIDLTPVYEGFEQPDFGGNRLKQAIIDLLPAAYRYGILQLEQVTDPQFDAERKRAMSTILGTSGLAATAAAVPLPWVDIPVVMGLQTHLIYKLANIYQQQIDAATIAQLTGVIGGRIAVQMGIRSVLKVIPWVGMAANAAAAFAITYATGMAWNWYFTQTRTGKVPSEGELREVFQTQLRKAAELWKTTRSNAAE